MTRPKRSTPEPYDLESSIGFLLYKAHQRAFAGFRRTLEPTGLTPPQFGALALLYRQDGQSQAALCERGSVDPNTMVGIVDRLEAAGLVRRGRDARDRRVHVLRITAKGRQVFGECVQLADRFADQCWSALSPAEQDRLREMLHKVIRSLDQRGE
jgi:DNA-binding MarR family transcriptional regulator